MSQAPSISLEPTADERTSNSRSGYLLGAGSFAEWTIAFSMNTLVMPVFTTAYGLSPTLVAWAITIPRLVDALSDPLIGHCSDRTRSPWGRRRPYILGGAVLAALCFIALWQMPTDWSQGAKFTHLLAISVFVWIGYGFLAIPLSALFVEVTDDYHERTRINTIRTLFCILPQFATGWLYWLALRPFFGGEVHGLRWISLGVGALIVGAATLPAVFARERFAHRAVGHIPLREGLRHALSSRPFVYLISVRMIVTLAAYIFTGMLFYIVAYHVCRGDKAVATRLLGIYATTQIFVSLAALPLAPLIGRRLDKRMLLIIGVALHVCTGLAAWFLLTPERPNLLPLLALFFAPAGVFAGVFTNSSLPDICDLDELKHGARREGLFSSVMAFVTKVEVSLCALMTGYMLSFAGFASGVAAQTPDTLFRLRSLGIAPYVGLTIVALLLALKYPLTAAQMAGVRSQLQARRQAAASAARSSPGN